MDKRDEYIRKMANTNFVNGLTASMFVHELGARALLNILLEKGIITLDEWMRAIGDVTEKFVELHTEDNFDLRYDSMITPEEERK